MPAAKKRPATKSGKPRARKGVKLKPTELLATGLRIDPLPPELQALADQVVADGGAVLAAYREPLGGNALLFVALPVDKVEPTPFQRDVSDMHHKKLADVIDRTGMFLDPIIAITAPQEGFWTPNGGHRPYFTTKPVALWLAHRLDFPNWTDASIRAMPETHISVWAQENGVAMDKSYMTEETEGGTLAIGDNMPGFERESLSVFTPAEWEKNKSTLTFDAWVTAARAAKAQ